MHATEIAQIAHNQPCTPESPHHPPGDHAGPSPRLLACLFLPVKQIVGGKQFGGRPGSNCRIIYIVLQFASLSDPPLRASKRARNQPHATPHNTTSLRDYRFWVKIGEGGSEASRGQAAVAICHQGPLRDVASPFFSFSILFSYFPFFCFASIASFAATTTTASY